MNRYVFIEMSNQYPFSRVAEIIESEETPLTPPQGISGSWYQVATDTIVQVGWKATYAATGWVYSEPTYQDYADLVLTRIRQRIGAASSWLDLNPVHYKVNLGVATPEEQATWTSYQQYYIAVTAVKNQPDYPFTIEWPVAPF
jgi:hypothetical protein